MITKIKINGYRIFRRLVVEPHPRFNLLVGANECGKSTLLEALALVLTGRINGRRAAEELNPYWFNTFAAKEFADALKAGTMSPWPTIRIEVFFDNRPDLQRLAGAVNSEKPTVACPGLSVEVAPNDEYSNELSEWSHAPTPLLPVEYYKVDWRSFADEVVTARPRELATAIIDSRTIRSTSGVDYHMRQILNDGLTAAERASISLAFRGVKASMSENALKAVNDRMSATNSALHDKPITLAMDQSARSSWEGVVTPHVEELPFSMSGQGQQAAIKISLAMSRQSERADIALIEEPENHLSHTSLSKLLARMSNLAGDQQQLFISTHSSFVLNRLGLDSLQLLNGDSAVRLRELDPETVAYFQKLAGHDTLRLALAEKIVLVEGPSDEILFERFFRNLTGKRPIEAGIDVIAVRGTSFPRSLALCAALQRQVAVVRDNDGTDPAEHEARLRSLLQEGRRELFVGDLAGGRTLEPQILHANDMEAVRAILGIREGVDVEQWMMREKTEGALRIAASETTLDAPPYIRSAVEFISA